MYGKSYLQLWGKAGEVGPSKFSFSGSESSPKGCRIHAFCPYPWGFDLRAEGCSPTSAAGQEPLLVCAPPGLVSPDVSRAQRSPPTPPPASLAGTPLCLGAAWRGLDERGTAPSPNKGRGQKPTARGGITSSQGKLPPAAPSGRGLPPKQEEAGAPSFLLPACHALADRIRHISGQPVLNLCSPHNHVAGSSTGQAGGAFFSGPV